MRLLWGFFIAINFSISSVVKRSLFTFYNQSCIQPKHSEQLLKHTSSSWQRDEMLWCSFYVVYICIFVKKKDFFKYDGCGLSTGGLNRPQCTVLDFFLHLTIYKLRCGRWSYRSRDNSHSASAWAWKSAAPKIALWPHVSWFPQQNWTVDD